MNSQCQSTIEIEGRAASGVRAQQAGASRPPLRMWTADRSAAGRRLVNRSMMIGAVTACALTAGYTVADQPANGTPEALGDVAAEAAPVRLVIRRVPPRSHEECLLSSQGAQDIVYKRCRYGYTVTPAPVTLAAQ